MSHKEQEIYFSLLNRERTVVSINQLSDMKRGFVYLETSTRLSWRVRKFAYQSRLPQVFSFITYTLWRIVLLGIGAVLSGPIVDFFVLKKSHIVSVVM